MAYRAAVLGGSGYAGAELLRLLVAHPEIEVGVVTADSNAGTAVADLYPSLATAYPSLEFEPIDAGALAGLDLVFCTLPHGQSQALAAGLVDAVGHVIDLGADFRLPRDVYEQWYGEAHQAPELIDRFTYGMTELYRADLAGARHVAAPGCYPTAASALALAPLLADGLVEPSGIVVDAVSGVSGAGRGLKPTSLFAEVSDNVNAYGLLDHRHTAEMEQALGHVARREVQVLFTPHLVPMSRGILATCYARAAVDGLSTAALLDRYHDFYDGEPFVVTSERPPSTKATMASNSVHLTVRFDDRTGTVLAIGALDNLTKGAAGQMVQDANLLLGLPETLGLPTAGVMP